MGRLCSELILSSPQYTNPVKERELDLRGNKIPSIENLGACNDNFDVIDFSDNELTKLDNFPRLDRLTSLLVSNNHVTYVSSSLAESLPNLKTLILSNNKFHSFEELECLHAALPSLTHLSLLDNPVSRQKNYRLFVIYLLPTLKVLDFNKVRLKERSEAQLVFGQYKIPSPPPPTTTTPPPTAAAAAATTTTISSSSSSSLFNPGEHIEALLENVKSKQNSLSQEEIKAMKEAILNAKTLQDINSLQKAFASGTIPGYQKENKPMDDMD